MSLKNIQNSLIKIPTPLMMRVILRNNNIWVIISLTETPVMALSNRHEISIGQHLYPFFVQKDIKSGQIELILKEIQEELVNFRDNHFHFFKDYYLVKDSNNIFFKRQRSNESIFDPELQIKSQLFFSGQDAGLEIYEDIL